MAPINDSKTGRLVCHPMELEKNANAPSMIQPNTADINRMIRAKQEGVYDNTPKNTPQHNLSIGNSHLAAKSINREEMFENLLER